MTGKDPQKQFHDALERLELGLETPFVPGDLEQWFAALSEAVRETDELIHPLFERTHKAQLNEIFQEDPGLEHRVEQLQRQDRETLEQFERFASKVERLAATASKVEPDEARIKKSCYKLAEEGLAVVIAARKQEVAIRTWLIEALERDRGVVD